LLLAGETLLQNATLQLTVILYSYVPVIIACYEVRGQDF